MAYFWVDLGQGCAPGTGSVGWDKSLETIGIKGSQLIWDRMTETLAQKKLQRIFPIDGTSAVILNGLAALKLCEYFQPIFTVAIAKPFRRKIAATIIAFILDYPVGLVSALPPFSACYPPYLEPIERTTT